MWFNIVGHHILNKSHCIWRVIDNDNQQLLTFLDPFGQANLHSSVSVAYLIDKRKFISWFPHENGLALIPQDVNHIRALRKQVKTLCE